MNIRSIIGIGLSVLLTACGGINYVGIETCNPGEVTFPPQAKKILMVNNALPQPEDSGYTYTLLGVVQDTATAKTDSALFDLCKACGRSILDASYFEDVLLLHDPLREKGRSLSDIKLTQEQVADLCEANNVDAVVSLDKMLFSMNRKIENIGGGFLSGKIKVKMNGIMRVYLPERIQPLATILIEDSVFFEQIADNLRLLNLYLPVADDALRIAGDYLGDKVASYFVPHWNEENRWFYSSANSRWKEAMAYASAGNWDEAKEIWKLLYQSSSSDTKRAKLASNIALTEEMQNRLNEAYNWAGKAANLFQKSEGTESDNTKLLKAYQEVLRLRIQSDQKLNIQIGNKD